MATAPPTPDGWDPAQYERFKRERTQPFHDLVGLVRPQPQLRVVDLGCGTGELTRQLHEQLGAGCTVGVDASAAMLARSAAFAGDGLTFTHGDIGAFAPAEQYDLIFSNAALHWVPDHAQLLRRLTAALAPDGQLAVQVPANFDQPSHLVAAELAAESPFREALTGYRPAQVLAAERYAIVLNELGYRKQLVRLQVYAHLLPSRGDVVEWVKGSLLSEFRRFLPEALYASFLARYRERLLFQLEDRRPYFYPFKRILFWAQR